MTLGDLVPEITSNWNLYYEGRCLAGVDDNIDLPEFENDVDEIRGAGIMGGWNSPAVGQFGPTTTEIKLIHLYEPYFEILDTRRYHDFTLRSSVQYLDPVAKTVHNRQVMACFTGRATKPVIGTVAVAKKAETSIELDLIAFELKIAGQSKLRLDKVANDYSINGENIYAEILSQI